MRIGVEAVALVTGEIKRRPLPQLRDLLDNLIGVYMR